MKIFLTLLVFTLSTAYGATCTATSRTNYSTGQILTSSALNADLNQVVTKLNGLDGGCVTDGTLEAAALNSTDFAAVTNGIHQGCAVSYSDANTVSVDKCILSVNGAFVKTATASTVTWGCSGCASEVVSTQYYVYAKTGSTGTSLNLLISTTAPSGDGYDASGNKILGKFYNNASSAIIQRSVLSWSSVGYVDPHKKSFSFTFGESAAKTACQTSPCGYVDQSNSYVSSITTTVQGVYSINLSESFSTIRCNILPGSELSSYVIAVNGFASGSTSYIFTTTAHDGGTGQFAYGDVFCEGY